jgi:signal transduction histidine kinase
MTAAMLAHGAGRGRRLGYWFTAVWFVTNGVFNLARGAVTYIQWPATDLFSPTLWNQVYFVGMVVSLIGWAFGFIMLTQDRLVTELIIAEQRAEQAREAKSDFLARMIHEIRTPLNGVIGMTGLVLDGPLTEDKRSDLELALQSAEVLLGIVNDILDLSKIEAGKLPITTAPFDLHNVLTQILALLEPQVATKSIKVRVAYPTDAPPWFSGDEMRVRQIIANFVSKAVKFTHEGEIELGVKQSESGVRIWVRDTGIGIERATLPILFSKFTQADVSIAVVTAAPAWVSQFPSNWQS